MLSTLDGSALATTFGLLNCASCEWRAFPAAASGAQGAQEAAARDHMLGGADDDWFKMTHAYALTLIALTEELHRSIRASLPGFHAVAELV